MKNIFDKIKITYKEIAFLYIISVILFFIALSWYRIETFFIIRDLYKELTNLSYFDYIDIYTHNDSVTLLYSCLLILFVLVITGGFRRIKLVMISLIFIIFSLVLITGIEFFKVYETAFQYGYIEGQMSSGIGDLLKSTISELSFSFYVRLAILLFMTPMFLKYIQRFFPVLRDTGQEKFRKKIVLYPPSILLVLVLLSAFSNSDRKYSTLIEKYQPGSGKGLSHKLHELSINPVYSLFNNKKNDDAGNMSRPNENIDEFLKSLDTSSLVTNKTYSRINAIPRKKYNIILYFFESFSYEYLNKKINNRYIAENWQRLGKNSLKAMNHYTNFPLSANAMLSVFTSKYDSTNDDLIIEKYPDIKIKTISEILSDNGYRTCLIHTGGLGYVGQRRFLKTRKFDKIMEANDLIKLSQYKKIVGWGVDERAMIKPSIDFMKENPEKPFLMVYLPVNPHHPYAIPDESFRITGSYPSDGASNRGKWLDYLNSLHYADYAMGMLVDELEKEHLTDNTLIFIFADHGEAFYQHRGNYSHRRYIYEENIHVPFIIYNKKIFRSPVEYDGISRHIDILPTILDALRINHNQEFEGVSIISSHREQLALLHTNWHDDFLGLRDKNWKYIVRKSDGYEELYDLDSDPLEKNNVSRERSDMTGLYRNFISHAKSYKLKFYDRVLH